MEPSRKLGAITLSIALLTGLTGTLVAWAAPNTIKGIELNSTPASTEIVLRSDARIPHRVVARSSEKIVIDLGSVDPTRSIQTDFASAENIEQVILKPLASDKVRMVIRGEDLAPPVVTSTSSRARHRSKSTLVYQQESAPSKAAVATAPAATAKVSAPTEDGFAMTATTVEAPATETATGTPAEGETTTPTAEESFDLSDEQLDTTGTFNELADLDSENPPSERGFDRPPLVNTAVGENSITLDEPEATPLDYLNMVLFNISETLKNQFGGPEKGILFQISGITGILIMLGLFIRSKMARPDSLYPEEHFNPVAKPSLLDKLFGGKSRKSRRSRGGKTSPLGATRQAAPRPQPLKPGDRPVGLNSLTQRAVAIPPTQANPMVQQNQALRQYSQQAVPPVNQAPMQRDRSQIDRELKRSLNLRNATEQTHTRKPFQTPAKRPVTSAPATPPARTPAAAAMAAQPPAAPAPRPQTQQPAPSAGLPANNTEVLEFLRSVAELMEKDGKANVAEGIKKGMMGRPQA